ncbi:Rhamnosyl O-methyltransferase [Tetrabaena socialis]|uniref:Rhamnosyl O-methyltransferase n=1 Tax=Tetrabaena socialis TaxID=47790 RepID=A0A2J8A3Z7_9CHLO|nr:Rhamnosyl O-methyltransferase [Tetrabaena socialis]|eukprot:PNH07246.1 Rhamnosyl O-methyltransferase [Tetrabaena socialis]
MFLRGGATLAFALLSLGTSARAQQPHDPGHVAGGAHMRAGALLMQVEAHLLAIGTMQAAIQKTMAEIKALVAPSAAVAAVAAQPAGGPQVWPLDPASSFVSAADVVQMNNGRTIRVDDVLYGYDSLFEQRHLFSAGSWLGVQLQQDPQDLVVIQQLIWDIKPKVIFDIGTNVGGSAIFFAHLMSQYAKPGEAIIVSVERPLSPTRQAKALCPKCTSVAENPLWGQYVQFVQQTSEHPDSVAALEAAIQKFGGPVVVSVDGWHEYPEVFAECKLFHKYVTNGSYMIVQDTKLDRLFNKPGPRKAAHDFLDGNSNFVIDKSKEIFLYTQHSDGYLLRVRPEAA